MASGHVYRANRPNTWLLRPMLQSEDSPCQPGAVHTWPKAIDLQLPFLALGIELTIVCHQSLQALPGISDRTCNTKIVGEAFERKRVATWCQWTVRIFAPEFVHIGIVLFPAPFDTGSEYSA